MNYKRGYTPINFLILAVFGILVVGGIVWIFAVSYSQNKVASTVTQKDGVVAQETDQEMKAQEITDMDNEIKKEAASVGIGAAQFYSREKSYKNVCVNPDPSIISATEMIEQGIAGSGIASTTDFGCNSSTTSWAFQTPLISGGYWCVDSTQGGKAETTELATSTSCL